MQRRKFIIGAGALASGSAAAVGTGAFSSATAQREIQLAVQSDGNGAYLDFNPTSSYADTGGNQGTLRLTFDENGGAESATGLTSRANTLFESVFQIYNNGANEIAVSLPTVDNPRDEPGAASTQFLVDEGANTISDGTGYRYDNSGDDQSFDASYVDISWDNSIPAFNKPSNPIPEIDAGASPDRSDRVETTFKGKRYPGGKAAIPSGESVDVHVRFTISNARNSEDERPRDPFASPPNADTAPLVFEAEETGE